MFKLIVVLALCWFVQDRRPFYQVIDASFAPAKAEVSVARQRELKGVELIRQELLAGVAIAPSQGFPGVVPWWPMQKIGERDLYPLENILHSSPLLFLEMCLERYQSKVQGYSCNLRKRELVNGKLQQLEKLEVHFREKPFSVYMNWLEGASLAQKVLFVRGENNDKMLARPRFLPLVLVKDVDGSEAKSSGRYTIDQFGINLGTVRTTHHMRKAQERGELHVRYLGIYKEPRTGDRACYKFVRAPYNPPEDEGVCELTIFVDCETWLQVGSELKDREGNLIAEYFFRDIILNPEFKKDQFTRAGL